MAFAAVEVAETSRCPLAAGDQLRLGALSPTALKVLAAGAPHSIWERVDYHFAFAEGTLDSFHALEHVSQTATALFGEGTPSTNGARCRSAMRCWPIGWSGIAGEASTKPGHRGRAVQRASLDELTGYLRPQSRRLNSVHWPRSPDRQRHRSEGACKNYIGRRLKQHSPLADYGKCQSHGQLNRLGLRRPMDQLLGNRRLSPEIRDRTRARWTPLGQADMVLSSPYIAIRQELSMRTRPHSAFVQKLEGRSCPKCGTKLNPQKSRRHLP